MIPSLDSTINGKNQEIEFQDSLLVSNGIYCLLHSSLDLMLGFNSLMLDDDEMKKKLALEQEYCEIRRENQREKNQLQIFFSWWMMRVCREWERECEWGWSFASIVSENEGMMVLAGEKPLEQDYPKNLKILIFLSWLRFVCFFSKFVCVLISTWEVE